MQSLSKLFTVHIWDCVIDSVPLSSFLDATSHSNNGRVVVKLQTIAFAMDLVKLSAVPLWLHDAEEL